MKKILLLTTLLALVLLLVSWVLLPDVNGMKEESEILEYYKPQIEQNDTKFYTRNEVNSLLEQASPRYLSNIYDVPEHIVQPILRYSLYYDVPFNLIMGVVFVESRFDPRAINRSNRNGSVDYGLFQLNNSYRDMTVAEFLNVETNSREGISYLADMIRYFDGDVISAIAAYNAGPYRVDENNIPESTQMYIIKVLEAEDTFNIILNEYIRTNESIVLNNERNFDG